MSSVLIGTLILTSLPLLVGIGVSLFAKFCPKEDTYNKRIKPFVVKLAKLLDNFLDLKMGKDNADKIEESVFATVAYWLENSVRDFYGCLVEDNAEDKK
jgi:hypothetical protein